MYEELVYKLRHCNLYGEEPLHWVGIICDAAEAIEKLQSELELVKAEKEAAVKELKGCCAFCKFNQPGIRGISTECVKCLETNGDRPNWEWRGVQGGKDD